MAEEVLADTSFLFALVNHRDRNHTPSQIVYGRYSTRTLIPTVVLPELAYFLHQGGGGNVVAQVLDSMREGPMRFVDLVAADYSRTSEYCANTTILVSTLWTPASWRWRNA